MNNEIKKSNAPDPQKYALSGTEDASQIALFMWCAANLEIYPELAWLFAVPNGGFRTKAGAGKLRAMGVKRGVPDICLPIKRGNYSALWIELKRPATPGKRVGKPSEDQEKWIGHLRSQGFGACMCIGFEQAKQTLISYLEWKGD